MVNCIIMLAPAMGCLRVLLTVGFTVVQFTAVQQPFIAVDIVPMAVIDNSRISAGKLSFGFQLI